jgi:hypothetical protein
MVTNLVTPKVALQVTNLRGQFVGYSSKGWFKLWQKLCLSSGILRTENYYGSIKTGLTWRDVCHSENTVLISTTVWTNHIMYIVRQ